MNYTKYGRTFHCPWSEGATNDDKVHKDMSAFEGATIIQTSFGPMTIKCIVDNNMIGLNVLSFDTLNEKIEMQPIYNVSENKSSAQWYEIEMEDGTFLRVTENHYIWVEDIQGYRRVKHLLK